MKTFRYYLRIFLVGFIFAALVLGSVALKATHPETPQCEPSKIESCQPDYHPIQPGCPNGFGFYPKKTPVCPKKVHPCPLEKAG